MLKIKKHIHSDGHSRKTHAFSPFSIRQLTIAVKQDLMESINLANMDLTHVFHKKNKLHVRLDNNADVSTDFFKKRKNHNGNLSPIKPGNGFGVSPQAESITPSHPDNPAVNSQENVKFFSSFSSEIGDYAPNSDWFFEPLDDMCKYYSYKGSELLSAGEYKRALEMYDKAIFSSPRESANYSSRAGVHFKMHDNASALDDCNKAIELDSKNAFAFFIRGKVHHVFRMANEAVDDFTAALNLNAPNPIDLYSFWNRSISYTYMREYDKAFHDIDAAIYLSPFNAGLYSSRGIIYSCKGNLEKATRDFEKAISLAPEDPSIRVHIGYGHLLLSEKHVDVFKFEIAREQCTIAIEYLTKAIELGRKDAGVFRTRAVAYQKIGKYIEALEDYKKACKLKPSDERLKELREQCELSADVMLRIGKLLQPISEENQK